MEGGDPDPPHPKRPRLDSAGPLYTSSTFPPPPHQPVPRHPILPASSSPPTHYPPPTLPVPSPSYQRPSPATSAPPFDQRPIVESRALPAPSHGQRPGHGAPVSLPARSYSTDASYTPLPSGTPSHSAQLDPQGRRPPSREAKHSPMDHGGHPHSTSMYPPEPRPNGNVPNGYGMVSPQEQYGAQPIGPNQPYATAPGTPYGPGQYMGTPSQYGGQAQMRRKQVRATQACNNCRTRKQKCDENRPCQFCRENNYECQYKDVPPPKSDRTMMQILEGIKSMNDKMDGLASRVTQIERRLPKPDPSDSLSVFSQHASPNSANEYAQVMKHNMESERHSSISTPASAPVAPQLVARQPSIAGHIDNIKYENPSVSEFPERERHDKVDRPGLPADHTTAVHQLYNIWPTPMKEFFRPINNMEDAGKDRDYPLASEHRRGLLRIYGYGQGSDENDGAKGPASPASNSDAPATPPEAHFGAGYGPASPRDIKRSDSATPSNLSGDGTSRGNPGGLGPDGHLKLDIETIRRLHNSYLQNIDILQPILDKKQLQKMIDIFIASYSPEAKIAFSPNSAVVNIKLGSMKRKRSNSNFDLYPPSEWGYGTSFSSSKDSLERRISTAIVLLVLALGKVCEHKHALPGPVGPGEMAPGPDRLKGSPGSSSATMGGSPPLNGGIERERQMSMEPGMEKKERVLRNIDVMPGLAYYARATDILGNLHGGNEVAHAQACLLAGLYMGQYARVLESWSWINTACRVVSILIKQKMHMLRRFQPDNSSSPSSSFSANLLKVVYWSCLQLESDILAEMPSLPPSGISQHQDTMDYPRGWYENRLDMPQEVNKADEMIMFHYSAQIHLRIILNDAHKLLYTWQTGPNQTPQWAVKHAKMLEAILEQWRSNLPSNLAWDDNDPPATDINTARMRAKYYGARYIILRPFLLIAVKMEHPPQVGTSAASYSSPTTAMDLTGQSPDQREISDYSEDQMDLIEVSKRCIRSAIQSTNAFDRVGVNPNIPWRPGYEYIPERLIVTNIFGTLHAQFGNVLVLAALYQSRLRRALELSNRAELDVLIARTIRVLRRVAPNSPTLKLDASILEHTQKILNGPRELTMAVPVSTNASNSFDASMPNNL